MKRFIASVLLTTLIIPMTAAAARAADSSADSGIQVSDGSLVVTVLTVVGAAAIFEPTLNGMNEAAGRQTMRSTRAFEALFPVDQTPKAISNTTRAILRNTTAGDIIQIEYNMGTLANVSESILDLRESEQALIRRVTEVSRAHTEAMDEAARIRSQISGLRKLWPAQKNTAEILRLQKKLERSEKAQTLAAVIADDAEIRLKRARSNLSVAKAHLARREAGVTTSYVQKVVLDVVVDDDTEGKLARFLANGMTKDARGVEFGYSRLQVARVQIPSEALVTKARQGYRMGLLGFGVATALILEELAVGKIGDALEEKAKTHFAPSSRTEPKMKTEPAQAPSSAVR